MRNISHSIIIRKSTPMRTKSHTAPAMPMRIKRDRWTTPMRNMGHRLYFCGSTCLCAKLRVITENRGHLYEYVRQLWNYCLYAQLRIAALRSQIVTSKTMRICQTAVKELRHLCAIVQQLWNYCLCAAVRVSFVRIGVAYTHLSNSCAYAQWWV